MSDVDPRAVLAALLGMGPMPVGASDVYVVEAGSSFYGPFDEREEARDWAAANLPGTPGTSSWSVRPIHTPGDYRARTA